MCMYGQVPFLSTWSYHNIVNWLCMLSRFSRVQLFVTLWTVACQTALSMGFSQQQYWSRLSRPPLGDLPDLGFELRSKSPALAGGSLPLTPPVIVQLLSHVQLCNPKVYSTPVFPVLPPSPRTCSNSRPLSQWCHPTILSSVIPFSSHLQSFPASESFSNESALRIRWHLGSPEMGVLCLVAE